MPWWLLCKPFSIYCGLYCLKFCLLLFEFRITELKSGIKEAPGQTISDGWGWTSWTLIFSYSVIYCFSVRIVFRSELCFEMICLGLSEPVFGRNWWWGEGCLFQQKWGWEDYPNCVFREEGSLFKTLCSENHLSLVLLS